MNNIPKKILIAGGGTAGWMAANMLAKQWPQSEIRLVESKAIGIIGVGEGSTPHLKLFFDAIGLDDQEWMPYCNATYKVGISFEHWSNKANYQAYFHPFAAQTDDPFTLPLFYKHIQARLQGENIYAHPDAYFLESYLSKHHLAPLANDSFPFGVAYGYHFDSASLGKFLAEHAQKLGVKRCFGEIAKVNVKQDDTISSLQLASGELLNADFFVDCTGFNSLLMQQTMKVKFKSFKDNLVNNAAVVMPSEKPRTMPVQTTATALSNGWAWKIPLRDRFGNGYVYSDDYIDKDQAETELRAHLGLLEHDVSVRHLSMKVGRVEKHWYKNCLAVGLSQGFIEPLEATAIALTFNTLGQFLQCFNQEQALPQIKDAFNKDINDRFDGIRDYIVCHYKMNQRQDTPYWRDCAQNPNISENLHKILYLWHNSQDFIGDLYKYNLWGAYQPKSWACMLAGYGVFPSLQTHKKTSKSHYEHELAGLKDFIGRCGLNFKHHHEWLYVKG